jgi:hypothetical protein
MWPAAARFRERRHCGVPKKYRTVPAIKNIRPTTATVKMGAGANKDAKCGERPGSQSVAKAPPFSRQVSIHASIRACCLETKDRYPPTPTKIASPECQRAALRRGLFHAIDIQSNATRTHIAARKRRIAMGLTFHVTCAPVVHAIARHPFTAATIFSAPSFRSSAAITARPEVLMISLPFSTFVPSRRTTSGT